MKRIDENGQTIFDDFYKEEFLKEFNNNGFGIIENVLTPEFVQKAYKEMEEAIAAEVEYQGTTDYPYYGYVLSNAKYGGAFIELFDNPKVTGPMNAVMGETCIAYSYTSSSMPPGKGNSSSVVHTDLDIFVPDYLLRMGVFIPLVDLTVENGAMWYLPASQRREDKPGDEEFYANGKPLLIKAGTGFFFNTRLWHAGGVNKTEDWRHAITINICRPWMKQRVDIPEIMTRAGLNISQYSDVALQKLGFHSQIPRSYDEYFAPPEQRRFKQAHT